MLEAAFSKFERLVSRFRSTKPSFTSPQSSKRGHLKTEIYVVRRETGKE